MYQFNEFWENLDIDDYLDEKFTSVANKYSHFDTHGAEFEGLNADEYEELADEIQRKPVDGINILGYISLNNKSKRTAYCKYDNKRGVFVVYTYRENEPYTITCYKKTRQEYELDRRREEFTNIPKGK